MEDIVRIVRVIEYVGPRHWVENLVSKSVHGTKVINDGTNGNPPALIRAATIGSFADILSMQDSEDIKRRVREAANNG